MREPESMYDERYGSYLWHCCVHIRNAIVIDVISWSLNEMGMTSNYPSMTFGSDVFCNF